MYQNQGYPGMSNYNPSGSYASPINFPDVFRQVYLWLAIGMAIGFGVAWALGTYALAQIGAGQVPIIANPIVMLGSIIAYLAVGFTFQPVVRRASPAVGAVLYILFTALLGVMISSIFVVYQSASIWEAFLTAATMFALMSLIGFTTRLDLSKFGAILFMALLGVIVASVVNIFLQSSMLVWIVSIAGVVIFCGLTAYDTQWIKRNAMSLSAQYGGAQAEVVSRIALFGAFRLFLDFVNLFLFLLNLMGRRR
jgi:FtsH-binding integral membrane protein